jgi:hypothetical protein
MEAKRFIPEPITEAVDLIDNPIRHIFLFATGHYVRSVGEDLSTEPMIIDVMKIVERAFDLKDPSNDDIFKLILPWAWSSLGGPMDFQEMILFLRRLYENIGANHEIELAGVDEGICQMLLVILGIRYTKDSLILGYPDPKILPVVSGDNRKYRRREEG